MFGAAVKETFPINWQEKNDFNLFVLLATNYFTLCHAVNGEKLLYK